MAEAIVYWTSLTSLFSVPVRFSAATLGAFLVATSLLVDDLEARWWCRWGGLAVVMVSLGTLSAAFAGLLIADVEEDRVHREGWRRMLGLDGESHCRTGEW